MTNQRSEATHPQKMQLSFICEMRVTQAARTDDDSGRLFKGERAKKKECEDATLLKLAETKIRGSQ